MEKLKIEGKTIYNAKKILTDYPNYDQLSDMEKFNILGNESYHIKEKIDLNPIQKTKTLNTLELAELDISSNSLEFLRELENLKELNFNNLKLDKNVIIPPMVNLTKIVLDLDSEDLNIIKNLTNLEELTLNGNSNIEIDSEILKKFTNLKILDLTGIKGVYENLPKAENLEELTLNKCALEGIEKISKMYPKLYSLNLNNNPLSDVTLKELKSIAKKDMNYFTFKNTKIGEKLKNDIYHIEDKNIEKEVKKFLFIPDDQNISSYELMTRKILENHIINGIEIFRNLLKMQEKGLEIPKQKMLQIKNINELTEEELTKMHEYFDRIKLDSLEGLNEKKIEKLGNKIQYSIEGDLLTSYSLDKVYQDVDMKEIIEVMEQIKSQIPEDADDYKKFRTVYEIIGKSANFDYSGCKNKEEYVEGAENITRSLKGVLLEGRAVCAGYALALDQALKYNGIEARKVNGYAYGNPKLAHAWNQVCIDGKWYNADLTWDARSIQRGINLNYCLVSDEKFNKEHTAQDEVFECKNDYVRNI